jgi:hypothetical protein
MPLAVRYLSRPFHSFTDCSCRSEPLTQIVGGVMMLLAGVLNLLGKLVSYTEVLNNMILMSSCS